MHIDSHADLGLGYSSWMHILNKVLSYPVDERVNHNQYVDCFGKTCIDGIGDYLLFAVAYRWISKIVYCANAGSRFCFFARLSISLVGADALIGPKALVLLRSFAERRCTERRDLSEGRALRDEQSGKTVAFRRGRRSRRI